MVNQGVGLGGLRALGLSLSLLVSENCLSLTCLCCEDINWSRLQSWGSVAPDRGWDTQRQLPLSYAAEQSFSSVLKWHLLSPETSEFTPWSPQREGQQQARVGEAISVSSMCIYLCLFVYLYEYLYLSLPTTQITCTHIHSSRGPWLKSKLPKMQQLPD